MPSNSFKIKKTVASVQTDITADIQWDSLQLTQVLTKEVSKLQFSITKGPGKSAPVMGNQIDVYQNDVHIFGGTITETETTVAGGILPIVQITVTDWSFKLDSKLVAKNYAQMDPADIVADIITNYTDGTYTLNNVQRGNFLVPSIKFNYEPVTKCLQKLASLIGWDWNVDQDKDVHFFLSENNFAPFDIDDTSGMVEWPSIDVDQDLTNMKNSVYVIGGNYTKTLTAATAKDKYIGDGTKVIFPLAYPYDSSTIIVTLNGVHQTVGNANQVTDPTTVQVLYNETNRYVEFTTYTPLDTDLIKIYGKAKLPILGHKSDPLGITLYGERQDSIVDKQITTVAEAQARAAAEILQYGHAVYTVRFNTVEPGLRIGQIINLNSVKLGFINVPLTIKRLTAVSYSPFKVRWQVECYGSDQVSFVDIMQTLLQQENNQNSVTDDTILETLVSLDEVINIGESLAVGSPRYGPYKWS